jgi:vacuolar protein sorting-associated protein 13A/C
MIGNPLGLVDKLGTGVIEFFNEPRKGLLKGPEEFVGGIGKGVKSLATNVVSGSFDSVSRITGSLYSVIKNVSGEEKVELKKPDHIIDGVYEGVKGGV